MDRIQITHMAPSMFATRFFCFKKLARLFSKVYSLSLSFKHFFIFFKKMPDYFNCGKNGVVISQDLPSQCYEQIRFVVVVTKLAKNCSWEYNLPGQNNSKMIFLKKMFTMLHQYTPNQTEQRKERTLCFFNSMAFNRQSDLQTLYNSRQPKICYGRRTVRFRQT